MVMKKINTAIAISIGLLLPFAAMGASGDEVTIRVMEMHENSSQAVMNQIELPEVANDEARQKIRNVIQNRGRVRENMDENAAGDGSSEGVGDGEGAGDMDRDRLRDQDQTHEMDPQQDRDQEHEMDNEIEHEMEPEQEHEMEQEHELENEREDGPGNENPGGPNHGKG